MKRIMLFAAVLLVAAGCARELEIPDFQDETSVEVTDGSTLTEIVIHARFENGSPDTKSRLEMNDDGTAAKVLWTSGDKITFVATDSQHQHLSRATLTTDADGVSYADFSGMVSQWNPSDAVRFYAFYPSESFQGYDGTKSTPGIGIVIPSEQTAVPGGIAEGLNLSLASTDALTDDYIFCNIPSLIKFSLSGDIVASLSSIKFIANGTIAGECIMYNLDDVGNLDFNFKRYFDPLDVKASSTVILNKPADGTFQTDTDYYIAVYPGTTEGFSMIFLNEEGGYVAKSSTKTMELARSQITDMGTINVGDSFGDSLVERYITKDTPASVKPVDIVVIPDGFTKDQSALFKERAKAGIDFLFQTEPYKTYKKYFNVYLIWAASKEEGASHTDGEGNIVEGGYHDTAFGSRWGDGADKYGDMRADDDKVFSYVSAHCPEIVSGDLTIDEVPILIIVNDTRYGGRAITYSSGRTYCIAPFTDNGNSSLTWAYPSLSPNDASYYENIDPKNAPCHNTTNEEYSSVGGQYHTGSWKNTLVHEFGGHSFARLADEYWYDYWYGAEAIDSHTWDVPYGLNISGQYGTYLWQDLLDNQDYFMSQFSPDYGRIGVFQGAGVSLFNRWRSEMVSCMIDNRQYFSAWQRILIVKRIFALAEQNFSLDTFFLHDETADPLRGNRSVEDVNVSGPLRFVPMTPPPILIDNSSSTVVPVAMSE